MSTSVPPPHRCTILLVEDDPDLRDLLRIALTADGYAVSTAANGREALSHLRSTVSTCIIVLDLSLPVMDGHRFRATQLRDRSLAWIPIVVLSGGIDAAAQARELRARAFVRKPVDVDELRSALRRIGCCLARPRSEQDRGRRSELGGQGSSVKNSDL